MSHDQANTERDAVLEALDEHGETSAMGVFRYLSNTDRPEAANRCTALLGQLERDGVITSREIPGMSQVTRLYRRI